MPRSFLGTYPLLAVLVFGLVSCAKDKSTPDSYHPAPVLVKHGAKVNPSAPGGEGLDLQDFLSVESSHPDHYRVETDCIRGAVRSKLLVEVRGDAPVSILNLLPAEFAPFDPARLNTIVCSFPVTLFNENGSSRRDTHLLNQTIVSKQEPSIFLESALDSWKRERTFRFSERKLVNLAFAPEVRLIDQGLRLVCDGMVSSALATRAHFNLANLHESNFTFEEDPVLRSAKPLRSCRFVMGPDQSISALSDDFQILFDWEPVTATIVREDVLNGERLQGFMKGVPYRFVHYVLTNPTGADRRLRVPRRRVGLDILGWFSKPGEEWAHHQNHGWGQLEVTREGARDPNLLSMNDSFLEYALAPGNPVGLDLVYRNTHDLRTDCTIGGNRLWMPNFIFEPNWDYRVEVSDEFGNFKPLDLPHAGAHPGGDPSPDQLAKARLIQATVLCPAD